MCFCLTLSNICYRLRVNGGIQRIEKRPSLQLGIVAIEMGAFGLLATYLYIYR